MSIESKIRFKAAGLYIIVGIAAAFMLFYLYNLRSNIQSQKQEIESQHRSLALTNELIYTVGEAQSSVSLFISTNDTLYIRKFGKQIHRIDLLIDTLSVTQPVGKAKLKQIKGLLSRQASNITELNRQLNQPIPVAAISERIHSYKPKQEYTLRISYKKDTIYNTVKRKGFFGRLKEAFNPVKPKMTIVNRQRIDTVRLTDNDSKKILAEVDRMARKADLSYQQNIKSIGQKVAELIASDREISTQISALLMQLHRQTFDSVLTAISRSEKEIDKNYNVSRIGGALALALILLFIILIIYDVNKGKEARDKIRQVMESRHKLLLSVSHDIKSPLGSILGYLELRQQQGEDIRSMKSSARHILALLENLLEFSSLEQGSLTVSKSDFSIYGMNEEISQMFLPLAEAKKLAFSAQSDKVRIHSDQMKIKQIIINLVSNAIKYTRQGEVSLQMKYSEGQLLLTVADTGAGIPEDKLAEIYEPFTRVESNNSLANGSGLGMFVVKGLVDLLGGTIRVTSKVGEGTKVEVTIPCEQVQYVIKSGTKKIAIYEDDPVVAQMVRDMLLKLGHKVVEQEPDIILTDMEMGDITGLDILASAGNVPVVVMTGHSDYTTEKARSLGFDGFLAKPFTLNALREIFGEGEKVEDDLWGDDLDEILEIFRASTADNFDMLKAALEENDFRTAQSICHKMLPMFAQLGYPTDELRRMDARRGEVYEGWQADVEVILNIKV
ncbi:hybrid sensor histidine kinase/response regulator [Parabacteroides sp. FAFU027]|uniref:ATP-binding response regulator n=1 Tax=Parabacteroides sp. FAFU027 TaxID=2922715 RepID=UPI001FAF1FD4|nr:ATP-binding protein [Parabacteroides sp. FAFU027]